MKILDSSKDRRIHQAWAAAMHLGIIACWLGAFAASGAPVSAGRQMLVDNRPDPVKAGLTSLGHLPATNRLSLAIGLPLRNQPTLHDLLDQLYDSANPLFHQWLSTRDFAENFGPSQADYDAVATWARSHGLVVTTTYPNRLVLDVQGAVTDIERALQVNLFVYQHPTEERAFYAPDAQPSLDLAVPVLQISGLDNYSPPRPRLKAGLLHAVSQTSSRSSTQSGPGAAADQSSPNTGSGPQGTYAGNDFRAAYVPGTALTGAGQSVGLLQFDGYSSNDIAYYVATNHLPSLSISNVLLDGFTGLPSGNGGEVEVSLDIEMVNSMAPGISKLYVYMAGPSGLWHDILNRMASDNLAKQLSCSWYIPGGAMDTNADQIFQQMAAQGQSFFSASGDYDAFCGLIPFPGDTPYITEVGGTLLHTTGPGGAYTSEWAWNRTNGIGSGGGISTQYPIPAWQKGISMAANFGSTSMRNVPDVAFTADYVYVRADGVDYNEGGTSCAAPLWAGFCALVNQQATANSLPTVGLINPAIYNIATNGPGSLGIYTNCLHDITIGNNTNTTCGSLRFPAVPGYDLATGLGAPSTPLIYALGAPLDPLQIVPATGFAASGGVGGPFTPSSLTMTLTNIGTNALTWSLANTSLWLTVSSAGGSLSPGGPSVSVIVSLNTVASNLAVGSYAATLLFTNVIDGIGQNRQFALSVILPPTIVTQPANQTVMDGNTASFLAAANGGQPLTYQWQLNNTNLSDGGQISGSSSSNLIITGVSPTNAGAYRLIVTNAAGAAISSNALLTTIAGNVDHFGWGPIASPQFFNLPFPASVTAYDQANIVATNFHGSVTFNQGGGGGSNLVIQTSASISNSVVSILTSLGYNFNFVFTNTFSNLNLSNYSTIIIGMDGGEPTYADMAYLASFVNSGARLILVGGSSLLSFAQGLNDMFVRINTNNYSWTTVAGTPHLSVTMPSHPLAAGLPSTYNFSNSFATYYMARVTDAAATTIATNHDGYPCILTKPVGSGNLVMFINSAYDGYWSNPADSNVLRTVLANAMRSPIGGSSGIAVSPTNSGSFTNGVWGGNISVLQAATNVILSANDGAGHIGLSNPFNVVFFNTPPFFAQQPTNQTIPIGYNATFVVGALGSLPLAYSWQLNGTPISGATNSSYTTNNLPISASGSQFSCLVTNAFGSTNSQTATLTVVGVPPTITQQPTNLTATIGGSASFSVAASGSLPLSYFWLRNSNYIAGATNTIYSTNNVQFSDSGSQFVCLVTNAYGMATSSVAYLFVTGVTSTRDFILEGNYVSLPVATNGQCLSFTLLEGGRFNPAGTGGTNGVDFWWPGTPIYNYVVGVNGLNYVNGSFATRTVTNLSTASVLHALITGTITGSVMYSRDISFGINDKVVKFVDTIVNHGGTAVPNIVTLDNIDPDQGENGGLNQTFVTSNDVVSVRSLNDAVLAVGTNDNLTLLLGSESGLQIPSAVGFNNTNAYGYLTVVDPNGAPADIAINLAENYGTLNAGQSNQVTWYMIFGSSVPEVTNAYAAIISGIPVRLQLTPLSLDNCAFSFTLNGPPGTVFRLQSSTTLRSWSTLFTSTIPSSGSVTIIDPYACVTRGLFYRAAVTLGAQVTGQAASKNGEGVITLPPPVNSEP